MRRARAPLPGAVDNGGAPNGLRAQNGSVCHVMACPSFGQDYRYAAMTRFMSSVTVALIRPALPPMAGRAGPGRPRGRTMPGRVRGHRG